MVTGSLANESEAFPLGAFNGVSPGAASISDFFSNAIVYQGNFCASDNIPYNYRVEQHNLYEHLVRPFYTGVFHQDYKAHPNVTPSTGNIVWDVRVYCHNANASVPDYEVTIK